MTSLMQISDPHFGTERAEVVQALLALVRQEAPEIIVLSGDITQRATPAEFAKARAFADRLAPAAVLVIPGNHDIPLLNLMARALTPYANFRRAFGDDLEPRYLSADWFVVSVNTTRRWRHKDGDVSAAQVERVAAQLRVASPKQARVVVVHQPVAVPSNEDSGDLLHGREAAVRRWADAGADVIIGGHIHLPCVLPLHETMHGLSRRIWCVQAGTAVSSRVRRQAGNSVNLLRHDAGVGAGDVATIGRGQTIVERWDHDAARGSFVRVAAQALPLSGGAGDA